jgi:hypothetical protein
MSIGFEADAADFDGRPMGRLVLLATISVH